MKMKLTVFSFVQVLEFSICVENVLEDTTRLQRNILKRRATLEITAATAKAYFPPIIQ